MIPTNEFFIKLIDPNLAEVGAIINDSAAVAVVLTAGTPDKATLYSDQNGTSLANPATFTNGTLRFFTAQSVSSVDISILTSAGQAIFLRGLTPSLHRVVVDTTRRDQLLVIPFGVSDNVETDTGFDLPANVIVQDAMLRVTATDASETLDVGILSSETGGDADGFLALASVATAGLAQGSGAVNNGTNIDFVDGGTYGALLASQINGSDAVATCGGQIRKKYRTDGTAKSITYTGSAGSDTAKGFILLEYLIAN